MAPLSARRRQGEDAAAICLRLKQIQGEQAPITAVQEVAMTPRTVDTLTPRPVIRGPQVRPPNDDEMEEEEEVRVERVFHKYDTKNTGEVDMIDFNAMCESLELPLYSAVAQDWLAGRSVEDGLKLEDFKKLYAKILAAQSPAVRRVAGRKAVRLRELLRTESHMRSVHSRYANSMGYMTVDQLPEALIYLGFPDTYGDRFDRFVGEWSVLHAREDGKVDFHSFVGCVNLLVDFCDLQVQESANPTPRGVASQASARPTPRADVLQVI